jgi:hypothetical protein
MSSLHPARVGGSQMSLAAKPPLPQANTMITTKASTIEACLTQEGPTSFPVRILAHGPGQTVDEPLVAVRALRVNSVRRTNAYEWF